MIDLTIFFDIETIPTADPRLIEEIVEGITHPAKMSKAETIAAWVENEKPQAIKEAVAKTSLDGGTGEGRPSRGGPGGFPVGMHPLFS